MVCPRSADAGVSTWAFPALRGCAAASQPLAMPLDVVDLAGRLASLLVGSVLSWR
jgi:hypothetical protein